MTGYQHKHSGCVTPGRAGILFLLPGGLGVMLFHALGTDPVAEIGLRVVTNIGLDLVPVALVVADLLAAGADGDQPAEQLDPGERIAEFLDELLAFRLLKLPLRDVAVAAARAEKP